MHASRPESLMSPLAGKKITVTGGAGFLGSAVRRRLIARGIPERNVFVPRSRQYDLTTLEAVRRLYDDAQPDVVIHLAAEVGGIGANQANPGRFFYANLAMGLHLIEEARIRRLEKFVHTGTVCAYPKHAPVPFREEDLWNGFPEETNAPYGVAKKALFVMLDAYRRQYGLAAAVVVPVNLYGPGDNFDPRSSHVIPALIRRFEEAVASQQSSVPCWGTGSATREFLHVDDAAEGVVLAAERIDDPMPINLGGGREVSIGDLASTIAEICGYRGQIMWDSTQPDGQPRRSLDIGRARRLLGWEPHVDFHAGLVETVDWWRTQRT